MKGKVYRQHPSGPDMFTVEDDDGTYAVFEILSAKRPPKEQYPRFGEHIEWPHDRAGPMKLRNVTQGVTYDVLAQDFGLTVEQLKDMGFRITTQ